MGPKKTAPPAYQDQPQEALADAHCLAYVSDRTAAAFHQHMDRHPHSLIRLSVLLQELELLANPRPLSRHQAVEIRDCRFDAAAILFYRVGSSIKVKPLLRASIPNCSVTS